MTKKSKGEATKERVLDEAMSLFASNGFERTSFQQIANAVGLSQQGVMGHFPTKESLFLGVLARIKEELYQEIASHITPYDNALEQLMKHFKAQLAIVDRSPLPIQMYLLLYQYATFDPKYRMAYTQTLTDVRLQYVKYLLAGKREGLFHFTDEVESIAARLHSAFMGSLVNYAASNAYREQSASILKEWENLINDMAKTSSEQVETPQ
jgi:AcrR family transcriptional regulator